MHYGLIRNCDIANGPGIRVSLFVSGCTNRCEGCFQPETWDFNYGQVFTAEIEESIINDLRPSYIQGLTILGGEPFEPQNQRVLIHLIKRVREELPEKDIWCFTGFTLDHQLSVNGKKYCEVTDEILDSIDVLVDGKFELDKKNISLKFRGSENQRLIDMKATRDAKSIILWDK